MRSATLCKAEKSQADATATAPDSLSRLSPAAREEYWPTLALRHCVGLGARSLAKLLRCFGSARKAGASIDAWEAAGIPKRCIASFKNESWQAGATREWRCAEKSDAVILLWDSPTYPQRLRQIIDAPALLYCRGDLSLLQAPCVAIVGSRTPTPASIRVASAFGAELSKCGITIVSGMALGIDRAAHAGALKGAGRSLGVLGTGIEIIYPFANKDIFGQMRASGLLISEFAPDTAPLGRNFPIRNRIISGLSLGVVVVEAALRSGSLITARLALEQDRSVFAVPGAPLDDNSAGCKNLIRQGAISTFEIDDILRDLAAELQAYGVGSAPAPDFQKPDKRPALKAPAIATQGELAPQTDSQAINPEQAQAALGIASDDTSSKILSCLAAQGALHIDKLLELTGLPQGQLSAALIGLEMLGHIRMLPGSRYEAIQ